MHYDVIDIIMLTVDKDVPQNCNSGLLHLDLILKQDKALTRTIEPLNITLKLFEVNERKGIGKGKQFTILRRLIKWSCTAAAGLKCRLQTAYKSIF